jgi:hypothetical protein
MSFPTSPTNGQSTTVNGVEYTYNSSKNAWLKTTAGSGTIPATVSGTLTVTGNITASSNLAVTGNISQGGTDLRVLMIMYNHAF